MLRFSGELLLFFFKPNMSLRKKHHRDCALLVAPIVALSDCRFYMKFFRVFR